MLLALMSHNLIKPGDQYLRISNPSTKWVVERSVEFDGQPQHIRLYQEGLSRTITIAATVLEDERQFRRLDD